MIENNYMFLFQHIIFIQVVHENLFLNSNFIRLIQVIN